MASIFKFLPALLFGLFPLLVQPAQAVSTSTSSVTCSSSSKLQTKIDAVAAGAVGTINVSGTCTENIYVPAGKTIFLVGQTANQGAVLTPSDTTQAAAYSEGFLQIRNMTIKSTSGSATLVQADNGGTIVLLADAVTTSSAPRVMTAVNNSTIKIRNSRVTNTFTAASQDKAIVVDLSSSLYVFGSSNSPSGPDGTSTSISSGKDAVYCGGGSSVAVIVEGTGSVTVQNGVRGFNLNSCSLNLDNQTGTASNLKISNASSGGIIAYNSTIIVKGATITSNRTGIYNMQSRTIILGTVFGGSSVANTTDIVSDVGSTFDIDDFGGQTSFLSLNGSNFLCVNGGQVYYYRPYVVQNLTSYEGSCLKPNAY